MEKQVCYSTNDEDFEFTSLGDLFDELASDGLLEEGTTYYEADFRHVTASDVFSLSCLIESMEERLYEEIGEAAEGAIHATEVAEQELDSFIKQWIEKNTKVCSYYKVVGKSRPMKVTASDLVDN